MPTSVPAPLRSTKGEPPAREETRDNVQKPELAEWRLRSMMSEFGRSTRKCLSAEAVDQRSNCARQVLEGQG